MAAAAAGGGKARRRCRRCGKVAWLPARQRRCYQPAGLLGTYRCNGALAAAPVARQVAARPARTPQQVAARKLAHAQRKIAEKLASIKRDVKALDTWQKKANHYQRRAVMTEAELQAERAARAARAARPRRRTILVGKGGDL